MATLTIIMTNYVMYEAYWNAARAMCEYCYMGVPVVNQDDGWQHGEDEPCQAGAILDLIEKLNEVK